MCLDLMAVGSFLRSEGVDTRTNASTNSSKSTALDIELRTLLMHTQDKDCSLGDKARAKQFERRIAEVIRLLRQTALTNGLPYEQVREVFLATGSLEWTRGIIAMHGLAPTAEITGALKEIIHASTDM